MLKETLHRIGHERREALVPRLCEVLSARAEVRFAYLYGSFAEGGPFHDIDVGVYLDPDHLDDRSMPELALSAALSEGVRLPADVRVLNRAPVPFAYQVLRGRLLLEADSDQRCRFTERIVARYLDMRRLLRRAAKEAFAASER